MRPNNSSQIEEVVTNTILDKGKPVARRGRKAMGSYPSEGGRFKAARLPKGWTGPVSKSGLPGPPQGGPGLFFAPLFSLSSLTASGSTGWSTRAFLRRVVIALDSSSTAAGLRSLR